MAGDFITIAGARQNNLKGIDLQLPLNELIVVTGVSGSGKSSLAFDTIYAEGQRRYVETFSPYARQFLDRMDRPRVDRVDGIPPAIAIDQTNPVKTSRSTVGTMTELNDHLKLLFARAAQLHCQACGQPVRRDRAATISDQLPAENELLLVTFPVNVPKNFTRQEVKALLEKQGYRRFHAETGDRLEVVQDRVTFTARNRSRLVESLEAALKAGQGRVTVHPPNRPPIRFSTDLHCAACDIHYRDPTPSQFSFNSPVGACETCRGFGRTMQIDYDLVIPDETLTLAGGAVKPWRTKTGQECQADMMRLARQDGIPTDRPWKQLTAAQRRWVIDGTGRWEDGKWYGVKRYFDWLEGRSYRMHIRVLLSKYRAYRECEACAGTRLKPAASLWKLPGGRTIHDIQRLPIDECRAYFERLQLPSPLDEATDLVINEIRTRLRYLVEVGLGYLTLDRQSRTLSGGEVQRINLTTALGTSLVNTLFVLDEPSIGLHPRDVYRLIAVLHRLRDAGNTLLVVEHDPDIIRAADRIIDIGPGPGGRGGEIVFEGTQASLRRCRRSLTAQYLRDTPSPVRAAARSRNERAAQKLTIKGAAEHNLKAIDVTIPLNHLVCVTGVSGSGKSTLVHDTLYRALRKLQHHPGEAPGKYRQITGHGQIGEVVMVDQSPIGKTTRSNPASYVGGFDEIRKLFAAQPRAKTRGYTAGTFSFNSGNGRCPGCNGSGFEHVEMQFLSDVYLRCPDCDGKRYRREVLEVTLPAGPTGQGRRSVADVLDLTVDDACAVFRDHPSIRDRLAPLQEVGLGYLTLGQPVPTLSGGESQRLKLAGHLAKSEAASRKARARSAANMLFLFDEPTTGLHFADVEVLLGAFRKLLARGHSVVIIEHHLDVIRAADWIIDLGPDGGAQGGELVCAGPPAEVARCQRSHTGAALRGRKPKPSRAAKSRRARPAPPRTLAIRGAREHNLRNIDVQVPHDKFTVITGISGSGKSTLAFDILFAEGQRRYLESLNAYARQYVQPSTRPDLDAVHGIPPTVAIEQRTSRGGRKSTVATVTEIYHFLRLLYAKLGRQSCPTCSLMIRPQTPAAIQDQVREEFRNQRITVYAPLVIQRKGYYTDLARWAARKGYDHLRVDGVREPTRRWPRLDRYRDHQIDLPLGECRVDTETEPVLRGLLDLALDHGKGIVSVKGPGTEVLFSTKSACPKCNRSFPDLDPRLFSFNSKQGWCPTCYGTGVELAGFDAEQSGEEIWWNDWWEGETRPCRDCAGQRLRPEALAVDFEGQDIAALTGYSVDRAAAFFDGLKLTGRAGTIARDLLGEIRSRLHFLREVGLGYLSLDRAAPTLSGGEAQRIRLAAQLGSSLRGVCYILDEPTIGLHARDNAMLLKTLRGLEARGNTIVVVEHDEDTIRHAEHVVDLGPGAGKQGGCLVAEGTVKQVMRTKASITGQYLRPGRSRTTARKVRSPDPKAQLKVRGAHLHNLKNLNVTFPLGRLICVSGVSGSGKSTLVRDVLYESLKQSLSPGSRRKRQPQAAIGCAALDGARQLARVLEVDQTPIGKTPRSCPATYIGFWDDIRRLFAGTTEARLRGYAASRFSFNTPLGRCGECEGQGMKKLEMSFLPNVTVTCEACGGRRFDDETLGVRWKGNTIADVLAMSVDEAVAVFASQRRIHRSLELLQDVGLGYLTLGQQSPTLSGGEAQRIKLVTELAKGEPRGRPVTNRDPARTLYVLDEPTIGLHMADVEKLTGVLHRLVDDGHTVLVIEHNLDVIAGADWIIDLGPEGGDRGGRIVAQGPPRKIARTKSHTGRFLKPLLQKSARPRRSSSK